VPELPEVETMVRGLRPVLEGRTLRGLRVLDEHLLVGCDGKLLARVAHGASVLSVTRRGKWVVLTLGPTGGCIVIQPRMTGGFWLVPPDRPEHVRLLFEVRGRRQPVWFCDTRRLGKIAWHESGELAEAAFESSHGPDALKIDVGTLRKRLSQTGRAIKPALMDQKVLAGIGNIYADEILHCAAIHPQHPANRLRSAESVRLHQAIGQVLHAAIAAEGSSFDAGYRTVLGLEGGFLSQNSAYGREGLPCRRCGVAIERIRFAGLIGRSTYFCPGCQRSGAAS
jgi:formamidopyrimidine-DNA glycosylase